MTTFQTPGPLSLRVRNARGLIEVAAVEGMTTDVIVEPLGGDEASVRLAEGTRVELRERSGGQELVVEVPKSAFRLTRAAAVRIEVRCPVGTDVRTASASAEVRGRGSIGSLDAATASGAIHVEAVAGDARVRTASGRVALGSVSGAAEVRSASGDVEIERVAGTLRAATGSGDINVGEADDATIRIGSGNVRLGAIEQGRVVIREGSGNAVIGICKGSRLALAAVTGSGALSSELELSESPGPSDGPLVDLDVKTGSGNVTVTRAPARSTAPSA